MFQGTSAYDTTQYIAVTKFQKVEFSDDESV